MSEPMATYEWRELPWRKLEVAVCKLQRRIDKASQAGDRPRVHRLQRLLLKSRAAKLLAVRRGTQDNQGKHTAGVDGVRSLTPPQRLVLAEQLGKLPTGSPAWRVWIPKAGTTELRPLSIPTLSDRGSPSPGQARVGTGVGGQIRAHQLRVPARPFGPRGARGNLDRHRQTTPIGVDCRQRSVL